VPVFGRSTESGTIKQKETMMAKRLMMVVLFAMLVAFPFVARALLSPDDVPRMSKEELKQRMGSPNLVILDVRIPPEWEESTRKIKGAVREDPSDIDSWATKYSPGKTLVFYCG
jgi:hypothetical protein